MKGFNFKEFEGVYGFNFLSNIDVDVHHTMLNKFFELHPNKSNLVIFDVGTNAGSFVKVINTLTSDNEIHCFEPHPRLQELLKENYVNINLNEFCLSNYDGECEIIIPSLSVGLSSIINRPVFEELFENGEQQKILYKVPCKTIDKYCEENDISEIDYIKIDVEGAEMMVLEGAEKMLKTNKIKGGQFEHGQTLIDAGTSLNEVVDFLNGYGYNIYNLTPSDVLFMLE